MPELLPPVPTTVAANITQWREVAKLSQRELAKRAGCSESSLSRWEAGKAEPNLRWLRRLAKECGVSAHVLLLEVA